MAAEPSQLELARALRDEAKSLERRARLLKQMSAKLLDNLQSDSEEDTSNGDK